MLRNDVITNSLVAAGLLAFVGGSASASIISLGGTAGLTGNISSGAVTNGNTYAQRFDSTSGNNSVTGLVVAGNFGNSLLLTLTDMVYTTDSAAPVTLTVHIVQDYTISTSALSATASHQLNGNTTGTLGAARIQQPSLHNATALAPLDTGVIITAGNFNAGSGAAVPVGLVGSTYTIDTTYTFTLNRGASGTASIVLPNSGVDQVSFVVPAPGGFCALMICGAGMVTRRRR